MLPRIPVTLYAVRRRRLAGGRQPILMWQTFDNLDAWLPAPRTFVRVIVTELRAYRASFSSLFARDEQRHWALQYLQGLLLDLPRKSIEPMALALPEGNIRAMQQFIGEGAWDDAAILAAHQRPVAETLGEPDGVLIVDGSEFPKKGEASVGVARQYCGALGKIANCQAGVFVAYASRQGYTLLDRRLYMPAAWFTPAYRARRRRIRSYCVVTLPRSRPTSRP